MKWLRYRIGDQEGFGTIDGDVIRVHAGSMFEHPRETGIRLRLSEITWLTPCVPSKMLALWNNFNALAEKNGWMKPPEPLYFIKAPNSFAAHGQQIVPPPSYDGRVAYEGELAIVIGRLTKCVSPEEADSHIFGYTCANDVTALELIQRDPTFPQWVRAKSFDTFGVFGPAIETDFDPATACVRTRVGGRERQNYALSDMMFGPRELVSRISQDMTLLPGDVILCGTSLGVMPMKPGSAVEVEIDGIGVLANTYG